MKIKPLVIGDLKAKIPIVQGGMGVGISLSNLAGKVAAAGGVGIISSAQIGFKEEDFQVNPLKANLRAIKREIKQAKKIGGEGIVGINIMTALNNYKEQVIAAAEAGADLIVSGAGLPVELPNILKEYTTKIAPIVSSEKAAKVILKYWDKITKKTADMVVIEGPKAGGHLGFKADEIEKYNENYREEILKIKKVVNEYANKYSKKITIVLAGGISTKEDVKQALELGMDGVQVASLFVTTKECDADIKYKRAYVEAQKEDIVIVKSPVGMPGRAIKNKFMERVMNGEKFTPKKCLGCLKKCNPSEIPYCITERLINAAEGNVDEALIFCGANIYEQKEITTVREVIEKLFGKSI